MTFIVSSIIGAIGSNQAANTQASAQENAAATQLQMFNTITGQEQPFLQGGYGAESTLNELLGTSKPTGAGGTAGTTGLPGGYLTQTFQPTQAQLESYPGYQFQLQQGGQALTNSMTPGVGAVSGPALKSLMGFNQGLAASNYQNYFNQFQTQQSNIFNRLSLIAQLGQNAAGNLGTAGTQLGTGIAQAQAAAGGSLAGGIVGVSNNLGGLPYYLNQGGGAQSLSSLFGSGLNSGNLFAGGATAGQFTDADLNAIYSA